MSESKRLSVEEIKGALGADSAIYVGHITSAELLKRKHKYCLTNLLCCDILV